MQSIWWAIAAKSEQRMEEVLEERKALFEKHRLKLNLEKTDVTWVRQQR